MRGRGLRFAVAAWLTASCAFAFGQEKVGVYYFPGWKDGAKSLAYPVPWEPIKKFPEREPRLGWYREGEQSVIDQQLSWMRDYGLSFVVFDWYWVNEQPLLNHALEAYWTSPRRVDVQFAIMWANHSNIPRSWTEFQGMVTYWIENVIQRKEYLRIDGKPVVFIQLAKHFDERAREFSTGSEELIAYAQTKAKAAGLPGIYFVAGGGADPDLAANRGKSLGYSAYSAYNYHSGPDGRSGGELRMTRSYSELDQAYRKQWSWFVEKSDLPLIPPMTSGWDKRPWGGSRESEHDQSVGTASQFKEHLLAGQSLMRNHPGRVLPVGVICCWNEFGEGSIVEPTKKGGFGMLDSVRTVFGQKKVSN